MTIHFKLKPTEPKIRLPSAEQNKKKDISKIRIFRITSTIIIAIVSSFIFLSLWVLVSLKFHITWLPVITAVIIATIIKFVGKSHNPLYGFFSALLSFFTAIFGNLFSFITIFTKFSDKSLYETLTNINISFLLTILKAYTRPIDILMYAGTIYGGFWFAYFHKQKLKKQDMT